MVRGGLDEGRTGLTETSQPGQYRLLALALESAADGVLIIDDRCRPVFANEAGRRLLCHNLPPETPLSHHSVRLYDLEGRQLAGSQSPLCRALQGESLQDHPLMLRRPDGSQVCLSFTANPIRHGIERVVGAVVTFRDVTAWLHQECERRRLAEELQVANERLARAALEREQVEEALKVSEQMAAALLHAVSEALFVMDPEGKILIANAALAGRLGRAAGELVGVNFFDLIPPAVAKRRRTYLRRAVRCGKPVRFVDERDGRHIDQTLYPIPGPSGQVEKIAVFSMDVTDREHAEESLKVMAEEKAAAATRLLVLLDNTPEGVLVLDSDGLVSLANRAVQEMLVEAKPGACLAELAQGGLRRPDGTRYSLGDFPLARALRGEKINGQEIAVYGLEGCRRDLLLSAVPLPGHRAGAGGALAVFADVTQLKELDRHKDQFISYASHELRTPLTPLKGYTDLLRRRLGGREDARSEAAMVESIKRNVDRLERLADALLDVSQARLGTFRVVPRPTDLVGLAKEIVEQLQMTTDRHQLRLRCAESALVGSWDEDRLSQVLHHLVSNAINYSPDGGRVEVAIGRREGWVEVTVRDEGIGIPDDAQASIFEPFAKASGADRACAKGLGLGLYVCRQIISLHGGSIAVSSQPGKGSTFTISLPLSG